MTDKPNPVIVERVATQDFQRGVDAWMDACFTAEIKADVQERCDRFVEESLEFVQAAGYSAARAHALVDYTFGRPPGEINQEVGGVMVTLAAMCNTLRVDIGGAAETELARVWTKIDKIREKQAAKPTGSALPIPQAALEAMPDLYDCAMCDNPATCPAEQCAFKTPRLEAMPASLLMECVEWRSFESAPRDGSRFLAFGGGLEQVETCQYNERVGCWDVETATLDDTDHEPQGYNRPAMWMPMPIAKLRDAQPKETVK